MKICWDMLEGVHLTKNGLFKKSSDIYIEKETCANCGNSYLTKKYNQSIYCGISCAKTGKNRPDCVGEGNVNYKGGVVQLNIPLYETCAHQISYVEETRRDLENSDWLQVKCVYCGTWFIPLRVSVWNRMAFLEGRQSGENRLYCSENCKQACPIYDQNKYFKHATSREVDPNLRQMVLERDNWTCQICGKTVDEAQLHCHHMDPAAQNPMFQNDMDSCITLCKDCHNWVHTQYGCRYVDLRCREVFRWSIAKR